MIDHSTHAPAISRSHAEKRDSILGAAALVFCREGFAGANIDLVAAEAGVSRQTVYNHHGDKENLFVAVVREVTARSNAIFFETLSRFPDKPGDLEADLTAFAVRLRRDCIYNREGRYLRRLIQSEGERYPQLFADWHEYGPGKTWSALARPLCAAGARRLSGPRRSRSGRAPFHGAHQRRHAGRLHAQRRPIARRNRGFGALGRPRLPARIRCSWRNDRGKAGISLKNGTPRPPTLFPSAWLERRLTC
jgi:AcrR family transcriptional regulator